MYKAFGFFVLVVGGLFCYGWALSNGPDAKWLSEQHESGRPSTQRHRSALATRDDR